KAAPNRWNGRVRRSDYSAEYRVRHALPDPDLRQSPAAGRQLSPQPYRIVIEVLTKSEFRRFRRSCARYSEGVTAEYAAGARRRMKRLISQREHLGLPQ
ncbi:hypothetical protein, partial [Sinorhizobium meliloti]|uniref:hypothetical protein n=1 Tax=Rhizobium meliloti TaxID=382 RepID=UPI001AEC7C13